MLCYGVADQGDVYLWFDTQYMYPAKIFFYLTNIIIDQAFKVMGTIARQLKALSQNTPQSSIIL